MAWCVFPRTSTTAVLRKPFDRVSEKPMAGLEIKKNNSKRKTTHKTIGRLM
jgi:hypothetical protein